MNINEMYSKHNKLIHNVARKYAGSIKNLSSFSYDDIFQIASMGFVEACDKYNKEKYTSFTTYAYQTMNWYVMNSLRDKTTTVKFPRYFSEIWKVAHKNNFKNKEDDIQEIMKQKENFTYKQIKDAMQCYNQNITFSLDSETNEKETLYDSVVGSEMDETVVYVSEFVSSLTIKQQKVVEYLLEDKKQNEIAELLDISQAQVHRIIKSIRKAWITYEEE